MMREVLKRRFSRLLRESGEDVEAAPLSETDEAAPPSPVVGERAERRKRGGDNAGGVDFSKEEKQSIWPDLVLIDGGEGQLNAVLDVMRELGLTPNDIPIVGIAKGVDRDAGRERFFMPGKPWFRMEEKSPVLYYLQRLRDEAHRYAIGAHRAKRKADITRSPLDEIEGVGPARKRALLERFGSARGVERAALAELRQAPGINEALARRIYAYFRGER
jgi:excinuclease ABC subunit C